MKKIVIFLIVPFLFVTFCQASNTEEEIMNSISSELDSFKESLPQDILDFLPKEIWDGDFNKLIDGNFNEASIMNLLLDYLFSGLSSVLKSFCAIIIVIIISSVFNIFSSSFSTNLIKSSFTMSSSLCVAAVIFSLCSALANSTSDYINALCNVMESFAPLMASLYVITGNITSGAIANASFILFIAITERFLVTFMLPIVNICICFAIVKSFAIQYDFSGITRILKNSFTGVTVFVMSVFMFVLSCKNVISQTADSLSIKTAKFAISSFIPIIGSTVNDALRTITSSLTIIKNSCGIIAIIVVALLILPAIISLLLYRLALNITASMAKALGCNNECVVIEEASSICGFLLTLVICTGILFIFALTILIKTSVVL